MRMNEIKMVMDMLKDFGVDVKGPEYSYDPTNTRLTIYIFEKDGVTYMLHIRKSIPRITRVL